VALNQTELRQLVRELGGKDALFTLLDQTCLTMAQVHGAFDGLNNWFEANRANMKIAMDSGAGLTLTGQTAVKIGKVFYRWKSGGE